LWHCPTSPMILPWRTLLSDILREWWEEVNADF
jgi:hypothetical protein